MRLAVILPSRGLIFSATVEEVLREAMSAGCEWRIFFAHSRPIPACFNEPITAAMAEGFTHFWIVEDDMALPVGVLGDLLAADRPVVACDYPVGSSMAVHRDASGRVLWTGTGCLLATRDALSELLPFSVDYCYQAQGDRWVRRTVEPGEPIYGLHDVHLGMTLYERGTPVHVIPTLCTQRYVARTATPNRNAQGWHDVALLKQPEG